MDRNVHAHIVYIAFGVALRKESVDRNGKHAQGPLHRGPSLSARRAWIEIAGAGIVGNTDVSRSPQGERG